MTSHIPLFSNSYEETTSEVERVAASENVVKEWNRAERHRCVPRSGRRVWLLFLTNITFRYRNHLCHSGALTRVTVSGGARDPHETWKKDCGQKWPQRNATAFALYRAKSCKSLLRGTEGMSIYSVDTYLIRDRNGSFLCPPVGGHSKCPKSKL